jgi:serine/threonine-protein kinase
MILTREGMVFGTPEFMSPEQAQGKILDARSDIYSLAVILYELITGKLPFDARTPMEFVTLHVQAAPIPLATRAPSRSFPVGLQQVLDRAMAKRPEDRYQTAGEFASALKAVLEPQQYGELVARLPLGTMPQSQPPPPPDPNGFGRGRGSNGGGETGGAPEGPVFGGGVAGPVGGAHARAAHAESIALGLLRAPVVLMLVALGVVIGASVAFVALKFIQ